MAEAMHRALWLTLLVLVIALLPPLMAVALFVPPLLMYGLLANRTPAMPLQGKTVLVTGGSSGLGKALAFEAARRGAAKVILSARRREPLEAAAVELTAAHPSCTAVVEPCDITDPDAVVAVASKIVAEHGAPDLLCNNAGAGAWHHIEDGTNADALFHIACPYLGAVYLTKALVPAMAERGSGHVLNVTSASSIAGFRAAATYGSSRWAMRGLSQYLRADLAEMGIGVTLLNAGEIADTAYFSAENAGAESHGNIPWLFLLPPVRALSYNTARVARVALYAVESGTHESLVPLHLLGPSKLLSDLLPDVLHYSLRLGPNGRR